MLGVQLEELLRSVQVPVSMSIIKKMLLVFALCIHLAVMQ
jgi:hypothetical protein